MSTNGKLEELDIIILEHKEDSRQYFSILYFPILTLIYYLVFLCVGDSRR